LKRIAFVSLILTTTALPAADWPTNSADRHACLDVIIANDTSENITETAVCFDKRCCTAGVVGHGVSKGYIGWEQPVTTNAIVRWHDARHVKKEQTVSLIGIYDPKLEGELKFVINTTNVTAQFKKLEKP
jgi:hypothetical protein